MNTQAERPPTRRRGMMPKRKPTNVAEIQDVTLGKVRHSELGRAIESVEDELAPVEDLYKDLRDTQPGKADGLRMLLEQIDYLLTTYAEVR